MCQCGTITQGDERRRHKRRRNDGLKQALFIDSQTLHAREQGGAFQPQPLGCALRPGDHAVGLLQHAHNALIFIFSLFRKRGCGHGCFRESNLWQGELEHVPARQQNLSLIHISEPTRQAEISYAVFCLKKKKKKQTRKKKKKKYKETNERLEQETKPEKTAK